MALVRRTRLSGAAADDQLATGNAIKRKFAAQFSKVLANAFDKPRVIVPHDDPTRRENLESSLGVGADALVGVPSVDETKVCALKNVRWGEVQRVAA